MKFSSVIRFFLLFGLLISIVFICKAHQQEASVIVKAKNVIWTNPEGKQNIETYFPGEWVNVQNVEFKPNETVIRLLVRNQRPNISLNIPSSTVIKDKNKEYALRSVDGHEIGKQFKPSVYENCELILHFEPIENKVDSLDLIVGDRPIDVRITGIKPQTTRLDESCWRDDHTGDWIIGFFPEGIVYDRRFWTYLSKNEKTGRIVATDGINNLKIGVGKEKNGKRKMKIGDNNPISVSRIIGNTLPAYPDKKYKDSFVDSKYDKIDSVTISGWIRCLPEIVAKHKGREIKVVYRNIFTGNQERISTEPDSLGRFSITFPVPNTTCVTLDPKSTSFTFPVEPGMNYFVLEDFEGHKRMIMGDDVRVQNEIISYGYPFTTPDVMEDSTDLIETVDKWQKETDASIDELARNNPTLSDLFINYLYKEALIEMAYNLGQLRFKFQDFTLPNDIETYAFDNYWNKLPSHIDSYSVSGTTFINDFVDNTYTKNLCRIPLTREDGKRAYMTIPHELVETLRDDISLVRSVNDSITNGQVSIFEDTVKNAVGRIISALQDYLAQKGESYWNRNQMQDYKSVLKTLNASPEISDIFMSMYLNGIVTEGYTPLPEDFVSQIDSVFTGKLFKDFINQQNDKYKTLLLSSKASNIKIKSDADLGNLTDGEELFNKIVEPYNGRPVLIDVWGTWCGPCKEAMKDFPKEQELLKPYDVVFVFLSNNSKDETIKSIVESYGVTGDNVVHYNFPIYQQQALERFLKVSSYPSYILVGPNGRPIDIKVDARNLDGLVKLLQSISGK